MQLKLNMSCHLPNVYTKFQIDISKQVEKKSGKRGRTDGRTLPRHNTSRFSNGRIKRRFRNPNQWSNMTSRTQSRLWTQKRPTKRCLFSVFWSNWCHNDTWLHWNVWNYIIGTGAIFIRSYILSETKYMPYTWCRYQKGLWQTHTWNTCTAFLIGNI